MAPLSIDRVGLAVFAKPPRSGDAKTRLAAHLGAERAAELARAFVLDTWALVERLGWADPVLATTDVDDVFWCELRRATVRSQGDGDLGDRMERVLAQMCEGNDAALIVGTDMPGLPPAALNQARNALRVADVVIGPADDGGFYLVGCRQPLPAGALSGLVWSSPRTRAETEARLRGLGLVVMNVMPWFDVDEVADVERLRRLGAALRQTAPETYRALALLGEMPA